MLVVPIWASLFMGPIVFVLWRMSTAPERKEPTPPGRVSTLMTTLSVLALLMPLWTAIAWHTGFDPLQIFVGEGVPALLAYLAGLLALWVGCLANGRTRAEAHPVLARIQGFTFCTYLPSFLWFALLVLSYDSGAHT